jgi:hypothetical protein
VSHLVVDDLTDLTPWSAHAPNGSASTAISIAHGAVTRLGGQTMRVEVGSDALGHRVERTLAALDLTRFDDIELWVRCDRAADGSEAKPFFVEVRLGSAALAIGANGNAWQRLIPIAAPGTWQAVPLALDDLPAAVRGSVSQIRLTCVDASAPFALELDRITALRPELLADVDAALIDRIGGRLQVRNAAVPAVVLPGDAPPEPFFRITSYGVRPAPERSPSSGTRSDYTGQGFSIRPPSVPFDLLYAVDAVAADRADAAALLQFVYSELTPTGVLDVAGRPVTIEWVEAPQLARTDIAGQPTVYLKVSTAQRATAVREPAVPPFNRIDVEVDSRAVA